MIYDISQGVIGCENYPTHPAASKHKIKDMDVHDVYNLTVFSMCAHNGTHADAPSHFIKGNAVVTLEAAEVFAKSNLLLLGTESSCVGPIHAPMAVHLALLTKEIILIEGLRLEDVPEGIYWLNAAPLKLKGSDGAPCRATLTTLDEFQS